VSAAPASPPSPEKGMWRASRDDPMLGGAGRDEQELVPYTSSPPPSTWFRSTPASTATSNSPALPPLEEL